jgi:NADPH:quinone reductase-like Zn-dependent oxidoreductase
VGIVVAHAADVASVQVGDAVAITGATYTDYTVANAQRLLKIPEASREAVAGALSGMFGCLVVDCAVQAQPGQVGFVTAGAGMMLPLRPSNSVASNPIVARLQSYSIREHATVL